MQTSTADNKAAKTQEAEVDNTLYEEKQEHPISLYLKIWTLLFVLSALSYMVDYIQLQGFWRWFLILLFMVLKAGFIVCIFMHMMWERMALITAILLPPLCLLLLIALMALESDYTFLNRLFFFTST